MTDDSLLIVKKEKWFDRFLITRESSVPSEVSDEVYRRYSSQPLESVIPINLEIKPSTQVKTCLTLALQALNDFRNRFDVESVYISSNRLHVLPDQIMNSMVFNQDVLYGRTRVGHIYINDRILSNPIIMAYTISHELCHLTSYYWLNLIVYPSEQQSDLTDISYDVQFEDRQLGFLQPIETLSAKKQCNALNEAVTDLVSIEVRRLMAEHMHFSDEKSRQVFVNHCAYQSFVVLCQKLFEQLSREGIPELNSYDDVFKMVLKDYWNGTNQTLTLLDEIYPSFSQEIRSMENNRKDYYRAKLLSGVFQRS